MSTIRNCPKCGWEYDVRGNYRKCPACRAPLTICKVCGKYFDESTRTAWPSGFVYGKVLYCEDCAMQAFKVRKHALYAKHTLLTAQAREAWLARIRALPRDTPTLTEAQWLETCNHFKGCAICGKDEIDARVMFIPFVDGGRYCVWNIIPTCDRCARRDYIQLDMFKAASSARASHKNTKPDNLTGAQFTEKVQKIQEYLSTKIDEAMKATGG